MSISSANLLKSVPFERFTLQSPDVGPDFQAAIAYGAILVYWSPVYSAYFSRLYGQYRCKILPIAIFTYDQVRVLDELFTVGTIEEVRAVILGKNAGDLQ